MPRPRNRKPAKPATELKIMAPDMPRNIIPIIPAITASVSIALLVGNYCLKDFVIFNKYTDNLAQQSIIHSINKGISPNISHTSASKVFLYLKLIMFFLGL